MAKVLGIDLGTTNSCMATMEGGDPVVLENSEGARTTPSVVAFTKSGERLVGQAAKRQAITNPQNTIFSIKRFMGRKFDEVHEEQKRVPYKIVKAANGDAHVQVEVNGQPKNFSPPEISAMILSKMKADAEAKLGEKITQAVVTVPAYFNDSQRNATKDAGKIAGMEVLRIINEPTAASLAYGLDKKKDEKIAVYDLGGGTFDISVLEIGDGVFEVKATNGDTHLGGDDWDARIMDWIISEFKKDTGIDLSKQPDAVQRIKEEAEKAKIALSSTQEYEINLPFITADASGPKHIQLKLTRAKMEQLCDDLFQRTVGPVRACLKDAGVTADDIDELVMVGGMTRMPRVVETARSLINKQPHQGVNPDEVVAVGAAIQAGVLKGDVKDVVLLDVTPLSLGIETKGGIMTKLIERNTTIPTRRSEIFTTAEDMQPSVEIHVLQGERDMASFNKTLGKFQLVDLPPAPRGVPQIEVTFDIDANGIVHVAAKDKATGKEQSMTITGQSALGKDDIDQMVRDAEAHAEEDRRRREEAEVRNQADTLVYQTKKLLNEQGDKIAGDDKDRVESALKVLKDALGGSDIEAIKSGTEALMTASQTFAQKLYEQSAAEQQAAGGAPGGDGTSQPNDDDEAVQDDAAIQNDFDVAMIARERDDFLDALKRLQADFENYKKRILKQQTEHLERAAESLVEKLLPVLDTVDLAIAHGGEGLDQVQGQLIGA